MIAELALLTVLVVPAPVCGSDGDEPLRRSVLAALNRARAEAESPPLQPHPALCEVARWRASEMAAAGAIRTTLATYDQTNRRIYRAGYRPHQWSESALIGPPAKKVLKQWRKLRPDSWADAVEGDFEHVGIGLAWYDGRPVWSLLVALTKHTFEWRQAAPLRELDRVRAAALATVNRVRAEHRRSPVDSDPQLDAAAQGHAEDMVRRAYYGHRSPEGLTPPQRVRAAGYPHTRVVAENIAKGLFTPEEVVLRWMESSGHRRNILQRRVTRMGLGVAFGDNANGFEVVWVQVFATSR